MLFTLFNGAVQTTAAPVKVAVSTIKTMLQIKLANVPGRIVEWGCSFDASAAATPGQVELIDSGPSNPATVTATATADITQLDAEAIAANINTTFFTLSTTTTGYTATIEGTASAVRNLAGPQQIAPTNQFIEQFPLGYRPYLPVANYHRIRMTFGTTVNAYCYVTIEA